MDHADVDWHSGDVCPSSSAVSVRRVHVLNEVCPLQLTTEACQVTGTNSVSTRNGQMQLRVRVSDAVASANVRCVITKHIMEHIMEHGTRAWELE